MAEFVQSKMTVFQPDGTIFGSPEFLEKRWDDYCNTPKDSCHCIKEPFLMFPKGTNDSEICKWFDKMYPDGLLVLIKKRMEKKYGEEYVKNWDIFEKQLNTVNVAHLICTPPDLARTREFQAESRGHRMSIRPVDDAACLTEEDKKRLLQEFVADEEENCEL